MTVALSQPKANTYPKLVLSPTMFHPPPYYIPFSNSNPANNLSRKMAESLYQASGVCSDCVLKYPNMTVPEGSSLNYLRNNLKKYYDPFCSKQVGKRFNMELPVPISNREQSFNISLFCNCSKDWYYECANGIEGKPETFNVVTLDTLQNVEGRDFLTYLLNTNDMYRRKRLGFADFIIINIIIFVSGAKKFIGDADSLNLSGNACISKRLILL